MRPLFCRKTVTSNRVEFYNRHPENLLLVENAMDGSVVIRAAHDNFTKGQQRVLIRYLKSEGFISNPDDLDRQIQSSRMVIGGKTVRWIYAPAWPHIDRRLNFYMWRLLRRILLAVMAIIGLLAALFAF